MPESSLYRELAEIPTFSSAVFLNSPDDATTVVRVTYNVRDHARNTTRTFHKTHVVSPNHTFSSIPESAQTGVVQTVVSPSKRLVAYLRQEDDKGGAKTRAVEIWREGRLVARKDVTKAHADFNTDEFFSCLSFSPSERSVVYAAEANPPAGDGRFVYAPNLGERMQNRRRPTLFVLRWTDSSSELVQLQPTFTDNDPKVQIFFGQAAFVHDDLVIARGYEALPDGRVLGIVGCRNRPSAIWRFKLPFKTGPSPRKESEAHDILAAPCARISETARSARSPRVYLPKSGPPVVIWLSNRVGGAHAGLTRVHTATFQQDDTTIQHWYDVDCGSDPRQAPFRGLFTDFLVPDAFLSRVTGVVLQSTWGTSRTLLVVPSFGSARGDRHEHRTTAVELTPPHPDEVDLSWTLLATDGKDRILAAFSAPNVPPQLILARINENLGTIGRWIEIDKPVFSQTVSEVLAGLHASVIKIPDCGLLEAIVVQGDWHEPDKAAPLILIPHGGPHMASTVDFNASIASFVAAGYTVALVNYIGSTGYGQDFVEALRGGAGDLDVEDCMSAVRHLVKLGIAAEGPGKQYIIGQSHGGFIAAHLIAKYPNFFSAVSLRNPVIAIGDMLATSDVPDWASNEFPRSDRLSSFAGHTSTMSAHASVAAEFGPAYHASPDEYARLQHVSPLRHVERVQADVLLLVGDADARVPMSQARTYYNALKSRKDAPEVEMLVFPGGTHALTAVEHERVSFDKTFEFFEAAGERRRELARRGEPSIPMVRQRSSSIRSTKSTAATAS